MRSPAGVVSCLQPSHGICSGWSRTHAGLTHQHDENGDVGTIFVSTALRLGTAVSRGILLSRFQDSAPWPRPLFHTQFLLAGGLHTLSTFIDSGVDVSLIDEELAVQLGND